MKKAAGQVFADAAPLFEEERNVLFVSSVYQIKGDAQTYWNNGDGFD
ncbi:MAG: hypothetical protein LHV69_09525 [Elusimicrobia bacterium]|nr:hypothetical protein [Candidatus Obscuribacterium magneticum]